MKVAKVLVNRNPEPLPGYKFKVYIQGFSLGFSKVTNLVQSVETEPLQEGGVNNYVYNLLRPQTTERTLVLERGVASRGILVTLATLRFTPGQRLTNDIIITVQNRANKIARVYLVHGATVRKINCSDLNAASGEVLIEQIELVYETLEVYPLTLSES